MSILIATLKSKTLPDVEVTSSEIGSDVRLEQDGETVVLDNATLQQLWLVIEREMQHR